MWRWFTYEEEYPGAESKHDSNHVVARQPSSSSRGRLSAKSPHSGSNDGTEGDSDVAPTLDTWIHLLTGGMGDYVRQSSGGPAALVAAFRGYHLRERLRRLPAREVEKHILGLHNNASGFRRVGLFLLFSGLYFTLVFYVAFQPSVQQALRDHVAAVSLGEGGLGAGQPWQSF
ncbi:unnamed protein product [Ectocarpus sp. CCAP 1310/34]|nr:unnamed protein product [Ectocarpus sp. CCAP 1310/34]